LNPWPHGHKAAALPLRQGSPSKVVLNQTFLSLTEFIEKSAKIYGTKLVSLDTP